MTDDTTDIERNSRAGSALIIALWIAILLSLIVSSFAFDMQIESRITSYYRKRLKATHLSRAGIEIARMLLEKSLDSKLLDEDYEYQDAAWFADAKRLESGLSIYGHTRELDTGTVSVDIIPEPARLDINDLKREDWKGVLRVAGVNEEEWDELIDCILDYKDENNDPLVYGAETEDYYATLDPPRRAKNGPFDTVDELLFVKGFMEKPEILYGGLPIEANEDEEPLRGMRDLLTVYGDNKINVNAAMDGVLMTLDDVDDAFANDIILEREGYFSDSDDPEEDHSYENTADFFARVPGAQDLSQTAKGRITTKRSSYYRIKATGSSHGVSRQISCIVKVEKATGKKSQGPARMTVLRWEELEGG